MQTTITGLFRSAALVAVALGAAACGIESQEAPSLIGPSGFAQSVTLNAVPDRLPRDGRSQSVVTVTVRNDSGQPVSGQRLTLGASAGTLSQADVVTGSDGSATFTLTAPSLSTPGSTIEVFATPVGGNFDNAVTRSVSIALTGASNSTAPSPAFTINSATPAAAAPTSVVRLADVVFDATLTTDEGQPCLDRCSYEWNFGEAAASGRIVTYQFTRIATFAVRLTVTDANGTSASVTRNVTVTEGEPPIANFTFSPGVPEFGEPVFFDPEVSLPSPDSGSRATIVQYIWNFGDSTQTLTTTQDRIVEHRYQRPVSTEPITRTYTVVLTVVDSAGRRASVSNAVVVADPPEEEPQP